MGHTCVVMSLLQVVHARADIGLAVLADTTQQNHGPVGDNALQIAYGTVNGATEPSPVINLLFRSTAQLPFAHSVMPICFTYAD